MSDIHIRKAGRAGRITLQRPQALNALTAPMIPAISAALTNWAADDTIDLVILDAEGDKAFCAGGDIADLYAAGKRQDYAFGQKFWADEYRLNAQIAEFPKPTVSFLQGFTMGGGVGLGCHCTYRIVGETSQIAMPECGIGLIPDVGGSLILAQAPGRIGEYLGLTAARMNAADAIFAGFADHYLPETTWQPLKHSMIETGTITLPDHQAPPGTLQTDQPDIDATFAQATLGDIFAQLDSVDTPFAAKTRKALLRASPLSMACALELLNRVRKTPTIRAALTEEYRFTARASEHGDFIEGIRAAIIDKDRAPKWRHGPTSVTAQDVAFMMAPLGASDLNWRETDKD